MIKLLKRTSLPQESQPRNPVPPLRVAQRVLTVTCDRARNAAPDECMGLLASCRYERSGVITHAFLLKAEASLARAVADPQGIAEAVARLRQRGMVPRGFWHSHVDFSAHHSSVDDSTMTRLLPGMAEENFVRPASLYRVPTVTASDEALLPLPDGTALAFTLVGPPIPGLDAHEKARWGSVTTWFRHQAVSPQAIQRDGHLYLSGGPVVLAIGLPAEATLHSHVVEASPLRVATMFSLVVNVRGETYCEALTVHDVNGRTFTEMDPCAIEVVDRPEASGQATGKGHLQTVEPVPGR